MASKKARPAPSKPFPAKIANKVKRQELFAKHKKVTENAKRDERLRRRREEDRNPRLLEQRRKKNVPSTLDRKRVWDDVGSGDEGGLGLSVDAERLKRRSLEDAGGELPTGEEHGMEEQISGPTEELNKQNLLEHVQGVEADLQEQASSANGEEDEEMDELDSIIDSVSAEEDKDEEESQDGRRAGVSSSAARASTPSQSVTSTNLSLMPEALAAKFPTLFNTEPPPPPKILVTTSLNSTLHYEGRLLTTLFPNSVYIPRSAHRYGHKYSIREIARFAANRSYTAVVVLNELQKRPSGLDVVHLPAGPMFHFSVSNWVEGRRLPDHGRPTNHYPELILNNFRTPLGLLTAHLFRSLFPPRPELAGRQVVTLHDQRDFVFVRRHRYVFREKRETEKMVQGADGRAMQGVEGIRAGLQELGPRFTLKLRRIDKGIQRASGQEWEWKGKTDRVRTKFQL